MVNKFSYKQMMKINLLIMPEILPILSDLDEMSTKNLKKIFTRIIPKLITIEHTIREMKRKIILSWDPEHVIEEAKYVNNYLDSLSLAQSIHFYYAKYERRIHFLKSRDNEVFALSKHMERFLLNYDAKYLDSVEFKSNLVIE